MEKAHNSYHILVRPRKARKSCLWKTVEQFMSLPTMYCVQTSSTYRAVHLRKIL